MANQQKTNIWIDGAQAGATLTELKKKVNLLNKEIKDLPRNSDEYKKKVGELRSANQALDSHRKEIRGIGDAYGSAKTGLKGLIQQFSPFTGTLGLVAAGIGGVIAGTMSWFKNNREMEKSLSSLRSITGASKEDIKFYKEEAIAIGSTSTKSAAEVVEAYKLIGSARPELLKNKEALAAVTKETIALSEAGEIDLASAAQAMAGSMNQFNLGAEHSSRIINALAAGAKEGAAEINDQTASIEKFGTVAAANNVTFEESVALTELMAEKNIKNSEAGTQLRNVLLTVATAASLDDKALKAMEQYGVNLEIVQNKALPLEVRLKELSKVQADQNALVKIFGKENVVAGQTVLGNIDKFKTLTDAVTGTNEAYKQQEINNDNLDGAIKKLGNAWDTYTLKLNGSEGATKLIKNLFFSLAENLESVIGVIGKLIVGFVSYKAVVGGARLVQVLFNAELRSQVFGMNQSKVASDGAATGVKNYGGALKSIGWAVFIGLLVDQAMAFIDVASGAEDAKDAVDRYNKSLDQGKEFGQKSVALINEKFEAEKRALDFRKANGDLTKKQYDEEILALNKSIDARIKGEIRLANENKRNASLPMNQNEGVIAKENAVLKELIALQKQRANATMDDTIQQLENAKATAKGNTSKKEEKDLLTELNNVIQRAKELSDDAAFQKFLQSYDEGLQKEIILLEKSIEDKYEKEIDSALRLMQEKGDVGIKATAAFNMLVLSMQEELERESLALTKKYNDEKKAADIANAKETHEALISNQEQFETSVADLKVSQAQIALSQVLEGDVSGQRKAVENLRVAEQEKNEVSRFWGLKRLDESEIQEKEFQKKRFTEGKISKEDYETLITSIQNKYTVQREQIETDSQNRIVEINEQTANQIIQIDEEKLAEISANLQTISDITSKFSDLALQSLDNEIQKEENNYKRGKKALEAKLKSGIITQDQYNSAVEGLDKNYTKEKNKLLKEQFELKKAADLVQAAINIALGATAAYAQGGAYGAPLAAIVAAAGAIQIGLIADAEYPETDQFEEGGFSKVRGAKDGKLYNAQNRGRIPSGMTPRNPSLVLVSEREPEYFVGGELLRDQRVANYVGMIDAIRTNKVSQFYDGGSTMPSNWPTGNSDQALNQNSAVMALLYAEIRKGLGVNFSDKRIEDLEKAQTRLADVKG